MGSALVVLIGLPAYGSGTTIFQFFHDCSLANFTALWAALVDDRSLFAALEQPFFNFFLSPASLAADLVNRAYSLQFTTCSKFAATFLSVLLLFFLSSKLVQCVSLGC